MATLAVDGVRASSPFLWSTSLVISSPFSWSTSIGYGIELGSLAQADEGASISIVAKLLVMVDASVVNSRAWLGSGIEVGSLAQAEEAASISVVTESLAMVDTSVVKSGAWSGSWNSDITALLAEVSFLIIERSDAGIIKSCACWGSGVFVPLAEVSDWRESPSMAVISEVVAEDVAVISEVVAVKLKY